MHHGDTAPRYHIGAEACTTGTLRHCTAVAVRPYPNTTVPAAQLTKKHCQTRDCPKKHQPHGPLKYLNLHGYCPHKGCDSMAGTKPRRRQEQCTPKSCKGECPGAQIWHRRHDKTVFSACCRMPVSTPADCKPWQAMRQTARQTMPNSAPNAATSAAANAVAAHQP